MWPWVVGAAVLLVAAWGIGVFFSLGRALHSSGKPFKLRLERTDSPSRLVMLIEPEVGVTGLKINSIWVNRPAAEQLGLEAPRGFSVSTFEPHDHPDLTPAERADFRRSAAENNQKYVLFSGQLRVGGGVTELAFPILGGGAASVDVTLMYSRRVGFVGESSSHSVSLQA